MAASTPQQAMEDLKKDKVAPTHGKSLAEAEANGEPFSPTSLFNFSLFQEAPGQNNLVEQECKPRGG